MRRSDCAVLQKLHSRHRVSNYPPPPFKSGNQATRDLLYDTSPECLRGKQGLCCRAPLAVAAKETLPLVVPNNSPLSQVQQQQVWQGKTLLFSQHSPEQLQHVTQTPAWHVCHNPLLRDRSSCCEQHSGSDCAIQLFGLKFYWKISHSLGSGRTMASPIVLFITQERTALTVKGSATLRLNTLQTKAAQPRRENDEHTGEIRERRLDLHTYRDIAAGS